MVKDPQSICVAYLVRTLLNMQVTAIFLNICEFFTNFLLIL